MKWLLIGSFGYSLYWVGVYKDAHREPMVFTLLCVVVVFILLQALIAALIEIQKEQDLAETPPLEGYYYLEGGERV